MCRWGEGLVVWDWQGMMESRAQVGRMGLACPRLTEPGQGLVQARPGGH